MHLELGLRRAALGGIFLAGGGHTLGTGGTMGFAIRKMLAAGLMPLPVLLLLGMVGWVLWTREKRKRLGQGLVAGALVGLTLISTEPMALALARGVEGDTPPFPGDSVDFVVVLGGAHVSDPGVPVSARLNSQSLYRLTEGVRIATMQPWSRLVLSGYGGRDPKPNAQVYAELAMALGMSPERMFLEPDSKSTVEEAEALEPLLEGHRFALVTSATHMDRALALFRARGLEPVPAPTGHLGLSPQGFDPLGFVPRERNLERTRTAWYELLGRIWAALRGHT